MAQQDWSCTLPVLDSTLHCWWRVQILKRAAWPSSGSAQSIYSAAVLKPNWGAEHLAYAVAQSMAAFAEADGPTVGQM